MENAHAVSVDPLFARFVALVAGSGISANDASAALLAFSTIQCQQLEMNMRQAIRGDDTYRCSICGHRAADRWKFCPRCGFAGVAPREAHGVRGLLYCLRIKDFGVDFTTMSDCGRQRIHRGAIGVATVRTGAGDVEVEISAANLDNVRCYLGATVHVCGCGWLTPTSAPCLNCKTPAPPKKSKDCDFSAVRTNHSPFEAPDVPLISPYWFPGVPIHYDPDDPERGARRVAVTHEKTPTILLVTGADLERELRRDATTKAGRAAPPSLGRRAARCAAQFALVSILAAALCALAALWPGRWEAPPTGDTVAIVRAAIERAAEQARENYRAAIAEADRRIAALEAQAGD